MAKHNLYTEIFKRLRSYFISPHLRVWTALRKKLFDKDFPDTTTSQLKDFKEEPPSELFEKVLQSHQDLQLNSRFSQLNDLELQPGKEAFENITAIITKQQKEKTGIVRSIPFYQKMIAAAAILVVLLSSILLLKRTDIKSDGQQIIVNNDNDIIAPVTGEKKDSLPDNDSKKKSILYAKGVERSGHIPRFNATNYLSFQDATIGDNVIPVEYNDLLFSFTKYPYRFGSDINWNENKGTAVKINAYTAIRISPYMSSVMADLYKVKSNGKATAKSRKARVKIARWKKTDTKRFNKGKKRNPLDIIDLAENVY